MWAAIAKSEPVKTVPKEDDSAVKPRVAVVDANAIINGEHLLSLMRNNDRVVTIPEVLREVRDKQSRQTLQNLPYTIQTQEPAEESIKAVMRFARATGDMHALSSVDVRLLALAHTLEVAYYGSGHLREQPPPPRQAKKKARDSKHLPGWGVEGGNWAELDKLNEEELAAAEAALMAGQTSRIATTLQQLTLSVAGSAAGTSDAGSSLHITLRQPGEEAEQVQEEAARAALAAAPSTNGVLQATAAAAAPPAHAAAEPAWGHEREQGSGSDSEGESEDEGEDDGGWVTAARTKNVQRRQRRREIRHEQRQAEERAAAEAAAAAAAEAATASDEEYSSDEEGESSGSGSEEEEDEAGSQGPVSDSAVCSVTADFAMQNVLLQMGLRLATPDGRRISQLSRWVLRCTACFAVTKEMGRLFCPKCGNAALDKVRVVVGPGGAEQYGVRKKHVLRGTKFGLPKPKGGRANDVILREDQLLAKMHRLRKKKSAQEELDPFAPEYTDETWHQAAALPGGGKGAQVLLAGWKHNPNERKQGPRRRK